MLSIVIWKSVNKNEFDEQWVNQTRNFFTIAFQKFKSEQLVLFLPIWIQCTADYLVAIYRK